MIWGFCVYFVYMIPMETDVLRKHRFQKSYYSLYCKFGNFRENFIFANNVKIHICDVQVRDYDIIYFHQSCQ